MSKHCILLYIGTHKEFINTDQVGQNLWMTLTYIFNFGHRAKIKGQISKLHTYGIRQCCMSNIKLLLSKVPEILSRQNFCSEGHWGKVKYAKELGYAKLHVMMMSHTTYEHSIINEGWVMARKRSAENVKFKIIGSSFIPKLANDDLHFQFLATALTKV